MITKEEIGHGPTVAEGCASGGELEGRKRIIVDCMVPSELAGCPRTTRVADCCDVVAGTRTRTWCADDASRLGEGRLCSALLFGDVVEGVADGLFGVVDGGANSCVEMDGTFHIVFAKRVTVANRDATGVVPDVTFAKLDGLRQTESTPPPWDDDAAAVVYEEVGNVVGVSMMVCVLGWASVCGASQAHSFEKCAWCDAFTGGLIGSFSGECI